MLCYVIQSILLKGQLGKILMALFCSFCLLVGYYVYFLLFL